MRLILTGSSLPATELAPFIPGLQLRPASEVFLAAKTCAREIAQMSGPVIQVAKQAILAGEKCVSTPSVRTADHTSNSRQWLRPGPRVRTRTVLFDFRSSG